MDDPRTPPDPNAPAERPQSPPEPTVIRDAATGAFFEEVGAVIGPYKLLEQLGEGGFGVVFMADQRTPVRRRVAVKIIKPGMDSRQVLARFKAEQQALALMDHPNIARVLDAGATDTGRPYFVMELVRGVPVTEYCDKAKLPVPERLKLFVQICHAVQHAHQKGIIHRDIKPSNVLVELIDGRPVLKVIDFGVAKAMNQQLTDETVVTRLAEMIGTPLYMSPEQAEVTTLDIDTRSDIYSLGVLLYELLTGSTPFDRKRLNEAAFDELRRIILQEEPPKPSQRLSTLGDTRTVVAANRKVDPQHLGQLIEGELDWIVMKALAKERDRRYDTANSFAGDIERYLNHEPVLAGPPSASYRFRKFVRRNRGQVIAAALVLIALVAGIIGTSVGLIRAERERRYAEDQQGLAEANAKKADESAQAERQARIEEAAQRVKAEKARDRTRQALDDMTSSVAEESLTAQSAVSADQKKFLTEVLKYYREFAGEQADDERSRIRAANAAYRVGLIEFRVGQTEQAAAAFRQAEDHFAALAKDFPAKGEYRQALASARDSRGAILALQGKVTGALEEQHLAIILDETLAAESPNSPGPMFALVSCRHNRGDLLRKLGKNPEAQDEYRKAIATGEKLVAKYPTGRDYRYWLAQNRNSLASLLIDGNPSEAERQFQTALDIGEKLVAEDPSTPRYRVELSSWRSNFGILLFQRGRLAEAEHQFRQALAIKEKVAAEFPSVPEYRRLLAHIHTNLVAILIGMNKPDEALEESRRALASRERLVAEFPKSPNYRSDLAGAYNSNASALAWMGKHSESLENSRRAIAVYETLAADFPGVVEYRRKLSDCHQDLATRLSSLKRPAEAEPEYRKTIALEQKLANEESATPANRNLRARAYYNLAVTLGNLGELSEAVETCKKAIALQEKLVSNVPSLPSYRTDLADYRGVLAGCLVRSGQIPEAIADLAEWAKSPNLTAENWYAFAGTYALAAGKTPEKKQEYAKSAIECLSKAVQGGFRDATRVKRNTELDSLRDRDDFKSLQAELSRGHK